MQLASTGKLSALLPRTVLVILTTIYDRILPSNWSNLMEDCSPIGYS